MNKSTLKGATKGDKKQETESKLPVLGTDGILTKQETASQLKNMFIKTMEFLSFFLRFLFFVFF